MRFSTAVATALVLAPLSMANQVQNVYPRDLKKALHARAPEGVEKRTEQKADMKMEMSESQTSEVIILWISNGGQNARQLVNDKVTVTKTVTEAKNAAETPLTIKVGGQGLVYSPPVNKNIPVGTTVIWEFYAKNHTVTQSTFDKPCEKMQGGFDTGFMPNPGMDPPPKVAMQILTSDPLWFKCSQATHCQKAMELAVKSGANSTAPAGMEGSKTGGMTGKESSAAGGSMAGQKPGAPGGMGSEGMAGQNGASSGGMGSEGMAGQNGASSGGMGSEGMTDKKPGTSNSEGGGANGLVGAAEPGGTVAAGQGTMVNGVCNCVAPCGQPGAGGEACTCMVLCGGVMTSSAGASGGMEGRLPTAMMAAMIGMGGSGTTPSASSSGTPTGMSSMSSSMSSMSSMAGMR
ncbi:hypothetical protein HRG_000888 [Hirsutella rhossiliensis]|uniref:Cupredoxin n=1 Tax=Hirsutella rhossiliensis TaxID=111463 RepID=A0A9P8N931_9HYPO|nr:uncharacterized protein HRG_00888 [Hirsutella rhossiliensis]KAH0968246.1 hypothetical protein HRG_00888 [Hirsutella rhossiliensis]